MPRALLTLAALLLLASCSYEVSNPSVTLRPGETATVTIQTYRYFSGGPVPFDIGYVSTAPGVAMISKADHGHLVTIHALQPGTAFITPAGGDDPNHVLVTVNVIDCMTTVRIAPVTPLVLTTPGTQVGMRVNTEGTNPLATEWYEERNGAWSPLGWYGDGLTFTPPASGTYRFRAVYHDVCGEAATDITVVASTRTHAVRR